MHDYDQHIDLISRLHNLPRIGQTNDGQTSDDASAQQTRTSIENISQTFTRAADSIDSYKKQLKLLSDGFGDLQHGLSVVSTIQETYNSDILKLVKNITLFDQVEARLAKTLKITTEESKKQTQTYGSFLTTLNTTRASLDKYRITLNSILPGQSANIAAAGDYSAILLKTQQHLQDFQGLSADQAASYTLYTEGAGKNIAQQLTATSQLAKDWQAATGEVDGYNTILTDISSMAADVRSQYSAINGQLELAVLKSRRFGMSVAQLDKIGSSLLDIEQSVGKEIEFQLISGKRLVDAQGRSLTNRFREAKLMNDANAMAEAMTDVLTEQGDIITGNNFLAKQALADSLGTSVQELVVAKQRLDISKKLAANTKDITEQQLMSLTPDAAKQFKLALEKEASGTDKEAAAKATESLGLLETLNDAQKSLQTPADKTEQHLQNIVDNGIFMKMKGKALTEFDAKKFADSVSETKTTLLSQNETLLEVVGKTQSITKLATADKTQLKSLAELVPGVTTLTTFIDGLTDAITENFPILTKILTGIVPSAVSGKGETLNTENTITTSATSHDDALIVNDGLIKFHPSDKFMKVNDSTMIAGTSVDGNKKLAASLSGGGFDTNKLIQAIQVAFAGVRIDVGVNAGQVSSAIRNHDARIGKINV